MKRKVRSNRRRVVTLALLIYFVAWSFMGAISSSDMIAYAADEQTSVSDEDAPETTDENAFSGDTVLPGMDTLDETDFDTEQAPESEEATEAEEYNSSGIAVLPKMDTLMDSDDEIYVDIDGMSEQRLKSGNIVDNEHTFRSILDKYGEVRLEADIGMEDRLSLDDGRSYFIDLNGHTLYRSGERDGKTFNEGGEVICISGGSSLEVADSSSSVAGKICGGAANCGGGVMVENGSFQAVDIDITDNFSKKGGAVYVKQGSVSLTGVTLEQNGVTEEGEVSDDSDDDSFFGFSFYEWLFGKKTNPTKAWAVRSLQSRALL